VKLIRLMIVKWHRRFMDFVRGKRSAEIAFFASRPDAEMRLFLYIRLGTNLDEEAKACESI